MNRILLLKANGVGAFERVKFCEEGVKERGGAGAAEEEGRFGVFGGEGVAGSEGAFRAGGFGFAWEGKSVRPACGKFGRGIWWVILTFVVALR